MRKFGLADALGIVPAQIASSLIFMAYGQAILVVASGGHRVDTAKVAAILGVGEVGKATADDVRAATSFAIGGVPPVVSAPRSPARLVYGELAPAPRRAHRLPQSAPCHTLPSW